MKNHILARLVILGGCLIPALANADYTFYGQAHLSTDIVRNNGESNYAIGSNGSRLGIKGSEPLSGSIQAVWKLESQLDFSGESGSVKARNRYLGVVTSWGTVVGGFQDTPLMALGSKVDVMGETIADRRSMVGTVRDQYDPITNDVYNTRAKRSIMYVSPRIAGLQVRALWAFRQFGHYEISLGSLGTESLLSLSAVYKTKFLYLGVASENHERYEDTDILRYAGGFTFEKIDINFIYETMQSGTSSVFHRDGYGVSFRWRVFDTSILGQAFYAEEDYHNPDSDALLVALGVSQKMSKDVSLYLIGAMVDNEALGSYRLGAADHGDYFAPAAMGDDLFGVSLGMKYQF